VTIYATILGGPSRAQRNADLAGLLLWGIDRYRTYPVVRARVVYARAAAPYGRDALALVAPRTLRRIARVDRPLVQKIVAPVVVSLPIRRGETLGRIEVWAGRRLVARSPLVASRSIARPGVGGRVGWYAERTVEHVWSWL
jgi:D-alanyl-D-alanine carboxypeptidase